MTGAWAVEGQGADPQRASSGKLVKGRQASRVAKAKSLLSGVFRRSSDRETSPKPTP